MVVHTFNLPSTWEAGAGDHCKFEARLIYVVSSRTVRTIWRDPVSGGIKERRKEGEGKKICR